MDPLLDHAPFGFLVIRDDGIVEQANATFGELLDAPMSAIIGHHVDHFLTAPSRIFYQSHFFPVLKLQGRVSEVYLSLVAPGGDEVPVLLNARRRETADGPRNDWAVVAMRTRNEYENAILEARRLAEAGARAKDEFFSFVSHELRSPLGAIRNWAAILRQGPVDQALLERGAEAIERNARLQVKLVDDMLDHARLVTGKLRVDLVPIEVRGVLEPVLEALEPTAAAKGVALVRTLGKGRALIAGDSERLQQVFWNILSNAVKFTPGGGRVAVLMRDLDGWVEVIVADTGKGIDLGFLPYVFESFRQEEGRIRAAEGGLGLGMSITRQLVELHGGSIAVASPGPDQGTTFTIRLPLLPPMDARSP